jgi:hypothetical protein
MNVPALGNVLIALAAPEHLRDDIAGDLQERFRRCARADGMAAAQRTYWADLLASLLPLCAHTFTTTVRTRWRSSLAFGCIVYVLTLAILTLAPIIAPRDTVRFLSPAVVLLVLHAVPMRAPRAAAGAAFVGIVLVTAVLQFVFAPQQSEPPALWLCLHYLARGAMVWGILAASAVVRRLVTLGLSAA